MLFICITMNSIPKSTLFKNKKQFAIRIAISCVLLLLLTTLIIYPEVCAKSFTDGLLLFSCSVLPTLFPFLFLTKMLTDLGLVEKLCSVINKPFKRLFGVNGIALYVFLMSILCGYPVGAKILSDLVLENRISREEANQMLPFCTSSGPLFIVGVVGTQMLENKVLGAKLFAVHFVTVFVVAAVVCNFSRLKAKNGRNVQNSFRKTVVPLDDILSKSMTDSCSSILLIGGFISVFYVLVDVLTKFKVLSPLSSLFSLIGCESNLANGIASGIFELTRGCRDIALSGSHTATVAISALLGFGGISIILQSSAFLSKARISLPKFILIKILQSTVAATLAFFIM